MADKKKDSGKDGEANQTVAVVASLDLPQLIVALHQKALAEVKTPGVAIQNSAVEGDGKSGNFYGAGQHIICAIPEDAKSLDQAKIKRSVALEAIKTYVQWFSGPDVVSKVTADSLKPMDNGADGKTEDKSAKKKDIQKSKKDEVAGQKYQESFRRFPSFAQYLTEAGGQEEDGEEEEDKKPPKPEDPGDEAESDSADPEAEGWYADYRVTIPGQKEHSISDALKHFGKDLVRNFGLQTVMFGGGGGEVHTFGELLDGLDQIFGKMDSDKFISEVNKELKKRMKQTDAIAQVWDSATICRYLKNETAKYKSQIKAADLACCIRVNKSDKSYKLFNEDAVANVVNAAIEGSGAMRGLGKRARGFGVKAKDVILVNNYQDNKKAAGEDAKYVQQEESIQPTISQAAILQSLLPHAGKLQHDRDMSSGSRLLAEMFAGKLLESAILILEGHAQEWKDVLAELDRCGIENLKSSVDKLRKSYYAHLEKAKKDNPDNEYVQDIVVNSKNWINRMFIGELRKHDSIESVKKLFKDCFYQNDGGHDDTRFEMKALCDALSELPAKPAEDSKEDGASAADEADKIEIEFLDVDDPSELEDPEAPTEADKEKFKPVGDPTKLIPGEDVNQPDVPEKDGYEFMGFEPDPEDMDESGKTYATYMKTETQSDSGANGEDGEEDEEAEASGSVGSGEDGEEDEEAEASGSVGSGEDGEDEADPTEKSFTIKVVIPDAEDQDNVKKQKQIAELTVIRGLWKPADLLKAADEAEKASTSDEELTKKREELQTKKDQLEDTGKSLDSAAKRKLKNEIEELEKTVAGLQKKFAKTGGDPEALRAAAESNADALKDVDNISGIESNPQAHGLEFDRWEPSIKDLAASGVPEGQEEAVSKAVFKGAVKFKRTDIDFYIIPMKGLKPGGED